VRTRPPTLPPIEWEHSALPGAPAETSTAWAQKDLLLYWSTVRSQPLTLSQDRLVRKRALVNLNRQLLAPDLTLERAADEREAARLYFLRILLQGLGLLAERGPELVACGKWEEMPSYWELSVVQRATACLAVWQRTQRWHELHNLRLSAFDLDLVQARRRLLNALRDVPANRWISAERLLSRLQLMSPRLLFANSDASSAKHGGSADAHAPHSNRLDDIEAAFVGAVLSGPVHWLGLVDITTVADRLLAVRINPSGAYALNMSTEEPPDEPGRVVVQADFHIYALGSVQDAVLASLERFAQRLKAERGSFEYQLSRDTVYQAQRRGLTISEIAGFLDQHAAFTVPQNVQRSLQEWDEQHERIVVRRHVALCETADAALLDRLWSDHTLRLHLERRATPSVAVIRPGQRVALQDALLRQELLPTVSPGGGQCVNRLHIMDDGELRPIHAGPDLLLHACLRHLAEYRERRYYLTQEAVERALASGMRLAQLLEQLETVHHGPLPDEWKERVRQWGHRVTKAHLRETVLLELQDAQAASDLLADPRLGSLLAAFPGDPSGRQLLVRTSDLDLLRQGLQERGIQLTQ